MFKLVLSVWVAIVSIFAFVPDATANGGLAVRQRVVVQRQPIFQRHRQKVVVQQVQAVYAQPIVQQQVLQAAYVQPIVQKQIVQRVYAQPIIAQPVVQQYCAPQAIVQPQQQLAQPGCQAFFAH